MLDLQSSARAVTRPLLCQLLISGPCLALIACGGGDHSASGVTDKRAIDAPAPVAQTPQPKPPTQVATSQKRAESLSVPSVNDVARVGVRSDVSALIVSLTLSNTQRSAMFQAALAMQAVLGANLGRSVELQTLVNDLAQAKTCIQEHLATHSEAAWSALNARTYDTLLRRLNQALFLVASRLFARPPSNLPCAPASPAPGGESGGDVPPPSSPPPPVTVTQQLRAEFAKLEQQGLLPALDRSPDVRGPDANGNGVRDDIDAHISALSLTNTQWKAAQQTARVQQRALLVDVKDKAAVAELGRASMAATACLADSFDPERRLSYDIGLKIEAITANTPERAARYMKYMAALSGTSTAFPSGGYCED